MTTPFLLLREGGKLLPIANNFFPELGGPGRQGKTVLNTLHHFEAVSGTPGWRRCSTFPGPGSRGIDTYIRRPVPAGILNFLGENIPPLL